MKKSVGGNGRKVGTEVAVDVVEEAQGPSREGLAIPRAGTAIEVRSDAVRRPSAVDLEVRRYWDAVESQAQSWANIRAAFETVDHIARRAAEIGLERRRRLGLEPAIPPEPVYCACRTHEGVSSLTHDAYRDLKSRAYEFEMLLDGQRMFGMRRNRDGSTQEQELLPSEFEMLREYIESGRILRPAQTSAGSRSSEAAARKTFENARRKVDIPITRYSWRAFVLRKRSPSTMNAFEFSPPEGFRYCLITPLG